MTLCSTAHTRGLYIVAPEMTSECLYVTVTIIDLPIGFIIINREGLAY